MTGFLLDANLTPKIARFLSNDLQLDVKSLHSVGLAALPDHAVIRLAQQERRVIVTLDRDFAEYFQLLRHQSRAMVRCDLLPLEDTEPIGWLPILALAWNASPSHSRDEMSTA